MKRLFYSFIILLIWSQSSFAQCDVSVEVPDDIILCTEDEVNLDGIISGTESCFNWTSDHGYFNDNETSPFVFVDQNTTFTFTAFGSIPGPNLITNGDFESGDDGSFTTDYAVGSSACPINTLGFLECEGVYEIIPSPSDGHTNFDPCDPLGSQQMVVNGAENLQEIWCQEIDVIEGLKYEFSAWAQSVNPVSPAELQFAIDGQQIGSILSLSSSTCDWTQIQELWLATSSTTVEICVTNQNTAEDGNDFAIDDIFFGELCSDQMEIIVTVGDLSIDPDFPDEFNCSIDDIELNLNPSGSNDPFTFEWTSPDFNIINPDLDGNATVFLPGTYIVEVTDALGCTIEHFFDVEGDLDVPEIELEPNEPILLCGDNFVEIFNNEDQSSYDYFWEFDSDFISNEEVLEATDPGEYFLTVTDSGNGCTSTASIVVLIDDNVPTIEAEFSNDIDCNNPTSELILNTSDVLSSIEWYDENGDLVTDNIVTAGGFYSVTATGENGCTADDFIVIPEIDFNPQFTISTSNPINCTTPTATLTVDIVGSFNFDWSGPNGFTATGNDLEVSEGGTYNLVISDDNDCSIDTQITISSDFTEPEIELAPISTLDCDVPSVNIFVSNFQSGNQYNWLLPNSSTANGQSISASTPGNYTLTVISPNGCSNDSIITVLAGGNLPTLNISADPINCINTTTDLIATGTYDDLTWSDSEGTISDLIVDDEGWYFAFADNGNGCNILDSIFVSLDTLSPAQDFSDAILDCDNPNIILSNGLDDNYKYDWTLPDGTTSNEVDLFTDEVGTYSVIVSSINGCTSMKTIEVTSVIDEPTFDVSGIEPLNCLTTEVFIEIDAISDLQAISLTGDQGVQQGSTFTLTEPGDYLVEVIGTNGCPGDFAFTIPIDTTVIESIVDIENINCLFTSGQLSITNQTPNYNYQWRQATDTLVGLNFESESTEAILLTTTNVENGCDDEDVFIFEIDTIPPTLTYQVSPLTCTQQEQEIFLFPDGDYEYGWILPDGSITITDSLIAQDTGVYQLIVSGENFCTNDYDIQVSGTIELPVFEVIQPAPIDCNNETTTIAVSSMQPLAGFTATLDGNSLNFGNGELVTDQPGEWTLQATAANGCTNTVDFIIELDTFPPSPTLEIENIDCINDTGLITITNPMPGDVFTWEDATNGITSNDFSISINHEQPISLLAIGSNGCDATLKASISIDTIAPPLNLTAGELTCTQPIAALEVIDPLNNIAYEWFFDEEFIEENTSINPNQAGQYTVDAFNPSNNCTTTKTIELLAEPIPVDFEFDLIEPPCGEEEFLVENIFVIGGTGPYEYNTNPNNPNWMDEDISSILFEGNNTIQIQDANGCILETDLTLSIPEPVEAELIEVILLNWGTDTTLNLLINKPLENIESILWSPDTGLSCIDCTNPTLTAIENQIYSVTIVDTNGCETTVEIRVDVIRNSSIYVPNVFTPENQDNNTFFPFATEDQIKRVDNFYIFDRWGNRVFANTEFSPNDPSAGWDGSMLDGNAQAGVYTYIMEIVYLDDSTETIAGDVTLLR